MQKRNFFLYYEVMRNLWRTIKVRCGDVGVKGAGWGVLQALSLTAVGQVRRRKGEAWVFCKSSLGDLVHCWVRTAIQAGKCETTLSSILIVRINTLHNANLLPPANLQADDTA